MVQRRDMQSYKIVTERVNVATVLSYVNVRYSDDDTYVRLDLRSEMITQQQHADYSQTIMLF